MRVSRSQAEQSRREIVAAAARLFREKGYDGIGISDLMKSAGMTNGGFYKKFSSKEDLIRQATELALQESTAHWASVAKEAEPHGLEALLGFYLSKGHRDAPEIGCSLATLGNEACRHEPDLKLVFENGVRTHLQILNDLLPEADSSKSMGIMAILVGALVLSRSVDDETLSDQFLAAALREALNIAGLRQENDAP